MNLWPLQSQCRAFYGDPESLHFQGQLVHVPCPWPLHMDKTTVPYIVIHEKCADSLKLVLENIWEACGKDLNKIHELRYDVYDGSYNYRPMRGSHALSMHAFGVAIDWDAADNAFHDKTHLFKSDSIIVVKFKEQGWVWGGDWSNPDAMHFQAARIG